MTQANEKPNGLTDDEWRLLRLFRRMKSVEQHETLIDAAKALMRRCTVTPNLRLYHNWEEALKEELAPENVEDFDDRLLAAWPGDWPGRSFVDLDVFGDPGAVLAQVFPEGPCWHIMGSSVEDEDTADWLVGQYLEYCEVDGFPLPTEFGATEEEMLADLKADFTGFIRAWRERVVATIESQTQ